MASVDEAEIVDGVAVADSGGVRVLTLSQPRKLNAWTGAMRAELSRQLRAANEDDSCKAVVLTGAGGAFCAGQDLSETVNMGQDQEAAEAWIDSFYDVYSAVRDVMKPVVAAINGPAAGSGFQFALLADVRIGTPTSRLGQPEVRSGIPSITGIWAIRELLGRAGTAQLALTGELVSGTRAYEMGLLTRLVDDEAELLDQAISWAAELGDLPHGAFADSKAWLNRQDQAAFDEAFAEAKAVHAAAYQSGEPQREMARFLAGRGSEGSK